MTNFKLVSIYLTALNVVTSITYGSQQQQQQQQDEGNKIPYKIQESYLYRFEHYQDSFIFKDKLRYSKLSHKTLVKNKFDLKKDPLITNKVTVYGQLTLCDNLTLAQPAYKPLLKCAPIDSFIFDDDSLKIGAVPGKDYIDSPHVKHKMEMKFGLSIPKSVHRAELYEFPLENSVFEKKAEENLLKIGHDGKLDFIPDHHKESNYLEIRLWPQGFVEPIECSGAVYGALNMSEVVEYDLFSFSHIIEGIERGMYVQVENFSCYMESARDILSVDQTFTLSIRQRFPYLTVRHTLITRPIDSIWEYVGKVDQIDRSTQVNPQAYDTVVDMHSQSGLLRLLAFHLVQSFNNTSPTESEEHMLFAQPNIQATVDSFLDGAMFAKIFKIFNNDFRTNFEPDSDGVFESKWVSDDNTGRVNWNLNFKRDFFSFTNPKSIFKIILDSMSPKLQIPLSFKHEEL